MEGGAELKTVILAFKGKVPVNSYGLVLSPEVGRENRVLRQWDPFLQLEKSVVEHEALLPQFVPFFAALLVLIHLFGDFLILLWVSEVAELHLPVESHKILPNTKTKEIRLLNLSPVS